MPIGTRLSRTRVRDASTRKRRIALTPCTPRPPAGSICSNRTARSSARPRPIRLAPADAALPAPRRVPRAGELHLWRFRCEWLPVPVQEGETWLSKGSANARGCIPNSALRKRFVSARVVTRWIVANLFDCEPHAVDLQDDGSEKLRARHPHDGRGITIDIAYGGIWIVIGIASTACSASASLCRAPGAVLDEAPEASRQRARYAQPVQRVALCAGRYRSWICSRAMPHAVRSISPNMAAGICSICRWVGKVRAAVALAQPATKVHAVRMAEGIGVGANETFSAGEGIHRQPTTPHMPHRPQAPQSIARQSPACHPESRCVTSPRAVTRQNGQMPQTRAMPAPVVLTSASLATHAS